MKRVHFLCYLWESGLEEDSPFPIFDWIVFLWEKKAQQNFLFMSRVFCTTHVYPPTHTHLQQNLFFSLFIYLYTIKSPLKEPVSEKLESYKRYVGAPANPFKVFFSLVLLTSQPCSISCRFEFIASGFVFKWEWDRVGRKLEPKDR